MIINQNQKQIIQKILFYFLKNFFVITLTLINALSHLSKEVELTFHYCLQDSQFALLSVIKQQLPYVKFICQLQFKLADDQVFYLDDILTYCLQRISAREQNNMVNVAILNAITKYDRQIATTEDFEFAIDRISMGVGRKNMHVGDKISLISVQSDRVKTSDQFDYMVDMEVKKIWKNLQQIKNLLKLNESKLKDLATELVKRETISAEDIKKLLYIN